MAVTKERFLIATGSLLEYASVTATNESESMPASNLLLPHPADWFVSPAPYGLEVTVGLDLEDGESWDFLAPLYANFGPSCTWWATAASSEAGLASPSFETDPVPGQLSAALDHRSHEWVHSFCWGESDAWQGQGARTEGWIRFHVNTVDPKMPRGYDGPAFLQWGNIWVSKAWQPPYHVDKGSKQRRDENPLRAKMLSGSTRVGPRRRPRKAGYSVGFLTRDEGLQFVDELDRRVGESGHVVTIFDPYDLEHFHREMIYGTIDSTDRIHVDTDVYRKPVTVNEAL
jgi:hypothetical protein